MVTGVYGPKLLTLQTIESEKYKTESLCRVFTLVFTEIMAVINDYTI